MKRALITLELPLPDVGELEDARMLGGLIERTALGEIGGARPYGRLLHVGLADGRPRHDEAVLDAR